MSTASKQNHSSPSLAKQLFESTWPMLFGVLSLMSFQLVDSAFIGQLGILPLAAQGFTSPMQMVFVGVQVGLGIATTAVISRALGENKTQYAKQLAGLIISIGICAVIGLAILVYAVRGPVLGMLGATDQVIAVVDVYWPYWLVSIFASAMLYFANSICRANGNTLIPGSMMVFTSVLNFILDPIFIFQLNMGIQGAAIASTLAFSVGFSILIYQIIKQDWLSFDFSDLNIKQNLQKISHIMGPAMVSQLLPPLSSMLATKLVAGFGSATIAAWALGSRYEFFAIVTVLALTMSMPPMIGKLLGKNEFKQIKQLVKMAVLFILALQAALAVITYFLAAPLANLMTIEAEVSQTLTMHLQIVPISLGALGVCMLMVSCANALGKSYIALMISGLRLFAFFLPCIWLGAYIGGLHGLFIGALLGNICAGTCAYLIYQKTIRKIIKAQPTLSHNK